MYNCRVISQTCETRILHMCTSLISSSVSGTVSSPSGKNKTKQKPVLMIHSFTNVSANITFSLCEIYIEKEKLSGYCLFRSQQFVTVCVKMFLPANERELYLCFLKRDNKVTNDFIKKNSWRHTQRNNNTK